jgi:hypothetical protein
MEPTKEPNETTMMYVELEMLDNMPINCNKKDLYPHDGVFLLKRIDGIMSVVSVERGTDNADYCYGFIETIIGSKPTIASENVMNARDVDKTLDEMRDKYSKKNEQREKELQAAYEMRKEKLEHDYEMKKLQLEQEMPKRFEQGEWVSGKTLTDIIKTLVGKEDKELH